MNMKVVLVFLLTLVILSGAPASLGKPQYLASIETVYGNGSCGTCHVNGNSDGPRTSYGTLFEKQPNYAADPSAALRAIGAPPTANPPTATPEVTATLTPTPVVTTTATPVPPVATATPAAPGFGIVLSLIGLFAWSLLAKRKNK
jgi:hypothetical protein